MLWLWVSLPPCQLPKIDLESAGSNPTDGLSRDLEPTGNPKVYYFINWRNKILKIVLFDVFMLGLGN